MATYDYSTEEYVPKGNYQAGDVITTKTGQYQYDPKFAGGFSYLGNSVSTSSDSRDKRDEAVAGINTAIAPFQGSSLTQEKKTVADMEGGYEKDVFTSKTPKETKGE